MFFNFVELVFALLIVFLTYQIIVTTDSVKSVLFLILLAINFSILLFFYKIDFLAILYLALYIGAVTVFFLFVVMMTDLNESIDLNKPTPGSKILLPGVGLLGLSVANLLLLIYSLSLYSVMLTNFSNYYYSDLFIDVFNLNIETLGFSIFTEYSGPFIIASMLILTALIGSIFITTTMTETSDVSVANISHLLDISVVEEKNKSQEMEIQAVRGFYNSIYLTKNK